MSGSCVHCCGGDADDSGSSIDAADVVRYNAIDIFIILNTVELLSN